ncbi:3-hydroxyisobutyrate dehydrogenase-like, mitochondrial [Acrasis kona]|uniref:3-hydroxyisobutyrate dehydrogenase-like, mitochondrial n=1 Tax=Acrasis kona TaxID=1008807 RepID=A0AAW2Z0R0_9EUKA
MIKITICITKPLIDLGAKFVETPREVAQNSDVIICIVGYPKDERRVMLGEKDGVISGIGKGSVIIDMTTSEPSLAREISEKAAEKGAIYIYIYIRLS